MSEVPPGWRRYFVPAVVMALAVLAMWLIAVFWAWASGNSRHMIAPGVLAAVTVTWLSALLGSIASPHRYYWWERILLNRTRPDFDVPDLPPRIDRTGLLVGLCAGAFALGCLLAYLAVGQLSAGNTLWAWIDSVGAAMFGITLIRLIRDLRRPRRQRRR